MEEKTPGELLQKILLGVVLAMLAVVAVCTVLIVMEGGEPAVETEPGVIIISDETPVPQMTVNPQPTHPAEPCEHSWEDGVCTRCQERCPHLRHDAESRVCAVCGETVLHNYVGGQCTRCGSDAGLIDDIIDAGLAGGATQHGKLEKLPYTYENESGVTVRKTLSVYLPYGYDPQKQYPVALLIHGLGGKMETWMEQSFSFGTIRVRGIDVVDRLIEENRIPPVLIVSMETPGLSGSASYDLLVSRVSKEIRTGVLPTVCSHYSTFAKDSTAVGIAAAREHFAMIGASDGALYTVESGLRDNRDLFGVYAPLSGLDIGEDILAMQSSEWAKQYPIRLLYMGTGKTDFNRTQVLQAYIHMLQADPSLIDGRNAFHHVCDGGHTFRSWFTDLANVLQLAFPQ